MPSSWLKTVSENKFTRCDLHLTISRFFTIDHSFSFLTFIIVGLLVIHSLIRDLFQKLSETGIIFFLIDGPHASIIYSKKMCCITQQNKICTIEISLVFMIDLDGLFFFVCWCFLSYSPICLICFLEQVRSPNIASVWLWIGAYRLSNWIDDLDLELVYCQIYSLIW